MTAEHGEVDFDALDVSVDVHAVAALAIRPGARVLDVGCGSGRLARLLAARHCEVVGVDRDPEAVEAVRPWCGRVELMDLESASARAALDGEHFDAVCMMDVLEHLLDPENVLRWAVKLLSPGGLVITSIPNVTHAAVRLQLLSGRFEYTASGLLDRTHLRFYDRPAAEGLLASAGLEIVDRLRTRLTPDQTEISFDAEGLPQEVMEAACRGEDALTYQFVFVCAASPAEDGSHGGLGLAEHFQLQLEQLHSQVNAGAEYVRSLEAALAGKDRAVADMAAGAAALEERAQDAERLVAELRAAVEEAMRALDEKAAEQWSLAADLDLKESYILRLQADADDGATALAAERVRIADLEAALDEASNALAEQTTRMAELDALVTRIQSRATHRIVDRVHRSLGAIPGAQRLARWTARRLAALWGA